MKRPSSSARTLRYGEILAETTMPVSSYTATGCWSVEVSSVSACLPHKPQHFLPHWRAPHRRKRLPMERRRSVRAQRFQMMRRAVALVRRKAVHRIHRVPRGNHAVALHLCNDRRRCNRRRERIAMDDRFLRHFAIQFHRVDQQIVGAREQAAGQRGASPAATPGKY